MTGRLLPAQLQRRRLDRYGFAQGGAVIVFGGSGFALLSAGLQDDPRSGFFLATCLLSFYLCAEIWRALDRGKTLMLIAPPLLASFLYFFLSHILSAIARLSFPNIDERAATLTVTYWDDMTRQALWATAAAFAMWRSYEWATGPSMAVRDLLKSSGMVRTALAPNVISAILGLGAYVACIAFMISTGTFGMASTAESREAQLGIMQFLNIGLGIGALSMFMLFVALFNRMKAGRPAPGLAALSALALLLQIGAGALAGFKSQVFMPFVIAGLAYYLVYRRIPMSAVVAAVMAIFAAYLIVEPYRAYLGRSTLQGQAGADLITALQESWSQRSALVSEQRSVTEQALSRFDLSQFTAVSLAYADAGLLRKEDQAWLQQSVYISPIFAFVPRAIWPDKPIFASGVWFSNNVWQNLDDTTTSVGMGPISFLYFIGGGAGIILGFAALGLLQAIMFRGVGAFGAGGLLIFVMTANNLVFIPSDLGVSLAGFFQSLPIALLAQFVFLHRDRL
jgi:hypothetical protein